MVLNKTQKIIYIFLFVFLLPSFAYADMADVIVDHSPANVSLPQIAADGNGHVYVVWEDTRNGSSDIYFNYSSDYGFTWQAMDIRLDTDASAANSISPQIACDNNGHVYVVWEDTRSGSSDIYLNYSSDYGATWQSSDIRLSTATPAYSPKVVCDSTGHVYVAWDDNYFNTSADYGATWLTNAIYISTSGGTETQLTCDQGGHVYIAWKTSTLEVLFNYSLDYGNTWQTTDRIISNAGAIPYGLSLDNDESGHVYCTWDDGRTDANYPDVYFNSSSDYGNTWGASDIRINTGTAGATYSIWPMVASDNTGHVYVAWYDRRNGLGDIYLNYSSDYGITWQVSDMRLDTDTPGAVDSGYPVIASDNGGHIYVIWTDDQAGIGPGLYLNYSLDYGANWLVSNRKIGSSGLNPQMVTDGSRFYMIRENTDILFNEVAPLQVPPFAPADPSPADGATQVSLTPTLSWRAGDANLDDTLTYDVYFGTSSPPSLVSSNQAGTTYAPGTLNSLTTYYWQVVARDSAGAEAAGPIWYFTTLNNPPQVSDFSPPDGATGVSLTPTLTWSASDDPGDTLTYDVYFGTSSPPPLVSSNQTAASYQPGQLSSLTTYYWQVVARDNHGSETQGPVLSFTTLNNPPLFNTYSPPDGTTGVDGLTVILTWSAIDPDPGDTLTYDIYFGKTSPPPLKLINQSTTSYQPGQLSSLTTYYWKIVAKDNHNAQTELPVLSFTTLNHSPQFNDFWPPSGDTGIDLNPTLTWSATDPDPGDTLTYDVYFGTSSPPPLVSSNQTGTSYQPGQLSYSTRYYWKIVARDNHGAETSMSVVYFDTISIDIIVDHSPANVSLPQIAADGNGHVYVVWEDTRNGSSDIYFNYASDYGFTWQPVDIRLDTDTPGASHSTSPQIACDNNGHVYVVWEDERNGSSDIYFNYSSDHGVTWQSSDKKLNSVPYALLPQYPKITCDNSGHVYVAWDDNYFNTSADYGATWLTEAIRISTSGGVETKLSCDQNGHVYVAWRTSEVLFNYSLDYGNTWQTGDRRISSTGAIPYGLSLASDEIGHVYVVWDDGRNGADYPAIYFNSSSDYGNIWESSDIMLNTGTPGATYSIWPKVAFDGTGHVYVTWYDRRNGLGDIYLNFSSDYGISWQASDKRLDTDTPGAADSGYPNIASDNGGHIYVIWTDDQADIGSGLYMNYSLDYGVTWLAANRKIGSSGFNPQMVTDGSRFYIIRDNNGIVFNEVAPLNVPPFPPADPSPADGATQVSITPTLSWRGGDANLDDPLTYDVYFGTTSPPPLVSSNQTGTTYVPGTLAYFTIYYWQVVARDSAGAETAGPIWSFQTMSGPPQFISFSPPDSATNVGLDDDLSWEATDPDPGDTITYDVYFGKTSPPAKQVTNYTSNTYNPGRLSHYTVYYWKVVARDNHGTQTVGPILSFTTINNPPKFYTYSPSNGATGVDLKPTLKWSASDPDPDDTLTYDIYFVTSSPLPLVVSNQTITSYQPGELYHMTTYYWKVVARDNHGAETELPILSFTTLNNPPQFLNFWPPHASTGISPSATLSWSVYDPDPDDTLTYDIYLGTSTTKVTGNGAPLPDIEPIASIDFGNVNEGGYLDKTITISNVGGAPLTITGVTSESGGTEFTYRGPVTPFTIPAGGSQGITVRFSPETTGPKSDIFHVYSNDPDEPDITFNVTGNGAPVPDIRPIVSIDFGNVDVGSYLDMTTKIFNIGTASLTITGVTSESGGTEFTYRGPVTPFTIPAGGSQGITVRFSPETTGPKSDIFHVYSNDPDEPDITFNVTGNGAPVPDIGPIASIDFGDVDVGSYLDKTTTIFNIGTAPLVINGVKLESGSNRFTYRGPVTPFTIPAGGSHEITLRFSPTTVGLKKGEFHVYSNDPDKPDVTFSLPPLVFSNQTITSYQPGLSTLTRYYWKIVAHDHHGAETSMPLVYFETVASDYPQFSSFSPVDGATGVDFTPTLSWSASDPDSGDTLTYDVYFGTSSSPPKVAGNLATTTYQPGQLAALTVYYWRVVARDNHGVETAGPLLSFTTGNTAPQFLNFSPADLSTNISLNPQLSWTASGPEPGDTLTYDIYFGTSPPLVVANKTTSTYKPGTLLPLTVYYWKIVARDNHGAETIGPVLSFTTGNPPYIESVSPNPCKTREVVSIIGVRFGDTQGTSEIHLGKKVFGLSSARIIMWSDIRVDFKVPAYKTWPSGTTKTLKLWVKVNGLNSNKVPLTITKP